MADISITAASVIKTASTLEREGIAGGTITAGMPLYIDSADANALKPAQADAATTDDVAGIALHGASDGQPIKFAVGGDLTLNAVLTAGTVYVLSANAAGGVAPWADLGSGDYVTIVGVATSTTNLTIVRQTTGITI